MWEKQLKQLSLQNVTESMWHAAAGATHTSAGSKTTTAPAFRIQQEIHSKKTARCTSNTDLLHKEAWVFWSVSSPDTLYPTVKLLSKIFRYYPTWGSLPWLIRICSSVGARTYNTLASLGNSSVLVLTLNFSKPTWCSPVSLNSKWLTTSGSSSSTVGGFPSFFSCFFFSFT